MKIMKSTNNQTEEKIFKIVKILSDETVIINAGEKDSIKRGDTFEIFGPGMEIKDDDTGESLGTIDNIKETVSVLKVFDKMCECSHISETASILDVINSTGRLYNKSKYKKILNVDKEQLLNDDNLDKTIRKGDSARLIIPISDLKSTN